LVAYSRSLEDLEGNGNYDYSHNEKNKGIHSGTLVAYPCQEIQSVGKWLAGRALWTIHVFKVLLELVKVPLKAVGAHRHLQIVGLP
jgi:hypothetical protein